LVAVLLFGAPPLLDPAQGVEPLPPEDLREAVRSGRLVALDLILADARRRVSGRVIDVELDSDDQELVYEIEILDQDGIVWELEYDARDGRFLSLERDD
jgi:uncharacterized membrane protein YkoI